MDLAIMRLDKYLADMQVGTRSIVKEIIRKGRVEVNGVIVKKSDAQVKLNDEIKVDGDLINYLEYEYLVMNKPADYLTACEDKRYPVVMDIIHSVRKDLGPVGRLDKDTEGVLLITNDGDLNHALLSPKYHVQKTYYAEVDNDLPDNAKEILSKPMVFSDFTAAPADNYEQISKRSAYLTISEGKFHQVKRMFAKLGTNVIYLKRVKFANLDVEDLKPGQYRPLSEEEITILKSYIK